MLRICLPLHEGGGRAALRRGHYRPTNQTHAPLSLSFIPLAVGIVALIQLFASNKVGAWWSLVVLLVITVILIASEAM